MFSSLTQLEEGAQSHINMQHKPALTLGINCEAWHPLTKQPRLQHGCCMLLLHVNAVQVIRTTVKLDAVATWQT